MNVWLNNTAVNSKPHDHLKNIKSWQLPHSYARFYLCICLIATGWLACNAQNNWFDDFENYSKGSPPDTNVWNIYAAGSSSVLVTNITAYNAEAWQWLPGQWQNNKSTNSVQLYSSGANHASMSRSCASSVPQLQRVSWSFITGQTNIDAMYLQVRNSANQIFCGVGLTSDGYIQYKLPAGAWAKTAFTYSPHLWYRFILMLDYRSQTFSLYQKGTTIIAGAAFATYQTTNFIPDNVWVQGPVGADGGTSYVDGIENEFLYDGSVLQGRIDSSTSNRYDLYPNCTYTMTNPLVLPDNFTLNGNGSTLCLATYTQLPLLVNSDWVHGNTNIMVSNLVIDGDEYDQAVNPAHNAITRYNASQSSQIDNVGIYFKNVRNSTITNVTFQNFPNEACMLLHDDHLQFVQCLVTNCALLCVSNNWAQAAVYTRWTTNSVFDGNQYYHCYEGGIAIGADGRSNNCLNSWTIDCAGGEGIFVGQSSYCLVSNNYVYSTAYLGDPKNFSSTNNKYWGWGAGIADDGVGNAGKNIGNVICYNNIANTGAAGVNSITGAGNQIFDNSVAGANLYGYGTGGAISLASVTGVYAYSNVVQSNANATAITVSSCTNCYIYDNTISPGNQANTVKVTSSSGILSTNNY